MGHSHSKSQSEQKHHLIIHHDHRPKPAPLEPLDFTKDVPTPDEIPYPPFVLVEGVPNFRDIGGYACPAPPGATSPDAPHSTRRNFAFRCSELSQLTAAGNAHMTTDLGITTLFDFRSEREAADPRGRPKNIKIISVPVYAVADIRAHPEMAANQLRWYTAPDTPADAGFSQGYVDCYRDMAIHGAKAFRTIFEHIRDKPSEAFVFHCTAGKDRTGVFSALVLKLAGVADETVAWEYGLTVAGMGRWEARIEREMVGMSMMPVRVHGGMTREEAERVSGSRGANMREWLGRVLEREFGGAEGYLRKRLGFSDEDVGKIRGNLVVEGEASVEVREVKAWKDHEQI
jgi:hypothetical protein